MGDLVFMYIQSFAKNNKASLFIYKQMMPPVQHLVKLLKLKAPIKET